MVVVKGLVSKVVHKNFADLVCWMGLVCKVDDTVFDNVAVDVMNVICLFPTKHYIIAIDVLDARLAHQQLESRCGVPSKPRHRNENRISAARHSLCLCEVVVFERVDFLK